MDKLNQNAINDVLNTDPVIRAEVLYKFLVEGISHRQIEKQKTELIKNHGWSSWKIIQFFGFGDSDKGQFSNLDFSNLQLQLEGVDLNEIAEYHIENPSASGFSDYNQNDGTDVLRSIKVRVGQNKLRKNILINYNQKCALCIITLKSLLITSHIQGWSKGEQQKRIDPKNAILLCKLHDGLFENGFISFDDNYSILFKNKDELEGQGINTDLVFSLPTADQPGLEYLKQHRKKHHYD
jgi:hypothetical protein